MERDLILFEIQQLQSWGENGLWGGSGHTPKLMTAVGAFNVCSCVVAGSWEKATGSLYRRLESAGLADHVKERGQSGCVFWIDPKKPPKTILNVCVCGKEPWGVPPTPTQEETQSLPEEVHEFRCIICDYSSAKKTSLFAHYDAKHRPGSNVPCSSCTIECKICHTTIRLKGQSQHYLAHHPRSLTTKRCLLCFETFRSVRERDLHMKTDHP